MIITPKQDEREALMRLCGNDNFDQFMAWMARCREELRDILESGEDAEARGASQFIRDLQDLTGKAANAKPTGPDRVLKPVNTF